MCYKKYIEKSFDKSARQLFFQFIDKVFTLEDTSTKNSVMLIDPKHLILLRACK